MEFTYLMQAIQTVAEPMNFAIAVISTLAGMGNGNAPRSERYDGDCTFNRSDL